MKKDTERTELGRVLKRLRESRGLTIKKLAEISQVGNGTIGDIESGKSNGSRRTLNILSRILNLTTDELNQLNTAFLGHKIVLSERVYKNLGNKGVKVEEILRKISKLFKADNFSEDDKRKLFEGIQEVYFEDKFNYKTRKFKKVLSE